MEPKLIVLSWHPATTKEIISGGYKRFFEIAKRTPFHITIVDRYPSIYSDLKSQKIEIKEYGKGIDLKFLKLVHPYLYDLGQRLLSVCLIFCQLLKQRPNVIYIPYSELSHLTLSAILYKCLFKIKVVFTNLNVNTIPLERPLNVFLHSFADRIITISSDLKQNLEQTGIKVTDINGVGFEKLLARSKGKYKFDAIFIGRNIPQKGVFDLIEIWDELVNKRKLYLKLAIVGNVPEYIKSEINMRIKKANLNDFITRFPDVSEDQKIDLLTESKMMVFPSHQEGWGIAPMEALSLGKPVVAYNLKVYNESIGSSMGFRTVNENDKVKFTETVLDTIEKLDYYSEQARKWKPILNWGLVSKNEWKIICSK